MVIEHKKELNTENNTKKANDENKVILIKSRNIEEVFEEINRNNLKAGDIVKIPSYNLFNLGNTKFFEAMESNGFKQLSQTSQTILEDGTFAWVKV